MRIVIVLLCYMQHCRVMRIVDNDVCNNAYCHTNNNYAHCHDNNNNNDNNANDNDNFM